MYTVFFTAAVPLQGEYGALVPRKAGLQLACTTGQVQKLVREGAEVSARRKRRSCLSKKDEFPTVVDLQLGLGLAIGGASYGYG